MCHDFLPLSHRQPVTKNTFRQYRVLGKGGFGEVSTSSLITSQVVQLYVWFSCSSESMCEHITSRPGTLAVSVLTALVYSSHCAVTPGAASVRVLRCVTLKGVSVMRGGSFIPITELITWTRKDIMNHEWPGANSIFSFYYRVWLVHAISPLDHSESLCCLFGILRREVTRR